MPVKLFKGKKSDLLAALTFNDAAMWGVDVFVEKIEPKQVWVLKNQTIKETWSDLNEVLESL